MTKIRKRIIEGKEYYYLEHSYREGNSVKKKELYLGTKIPENIDAIKKKFIKEIYETKWLNILDKIKKDFIKETKSMPSSLRVKNLENFTIKFTYDSQKIEGSKLTLRETANLLVNGIAPKERLVRDVKEAEAHKNLFYEILTYNKDLSMDIVLYWHKKLFNDTKPDISGIIRKHGVAISGSRFIPPSPVELNILLREFFVWYNKNKNNTHPVELAALVHLKFVTVHPFADGNGRISRLLMNFVLNKYNYPLFDIPYENRNSYYNALERSQVKNDENIFVQWFIKKYIKENKS